MSLYALGSVIEKLSGGGVGGHIHTETQSYAPAPSNTTRARPPPHAGQGIHFSSGYPFPCSARLPSLLISHHP